MGLLLKHKEKLKNELNLEDIKEVNEFLRQINFKGERNSQVWFILGINPYTSNLKEHFIA